MRGRKIISKKINLRFPFNTNLLVCPANCAIASNPGAVLSSPTGAPVEPVISKILVFPSSQATNKNSLCVASEASIGK